MGDEISTASMSDIAFLLLVFFIVSTIFHQEQGLPLLLPGRASRTVTLPPESILGIEVDGMDVVRLDGVPFAIPGLEREIRRRIAANPRLVVQLRVHPAAPYGTMVDVLDEVQLADAERVSIRGLEVVRSP
jgi:biopolymer transport protein ExbD